MFIDYSGKRPHFIDPKTGEVISVELFVAVLGASSRTYAEATMSQQPHEFILSHVHAFEYFGGVSRALVPDCLKSGVTDADNYEPIIQRTYEEMARHYGTAVVPARPAKPKDKAKVERAVQIAQRWILARLRNETFFSLGALNGRIAELLEDVNARKMRVYGASRNELFERLEKNALLPLPQDRFTYAEWKTVKVNRLDYHVDVEGHYYSAPHTMVGEVVEARITATRSSCTFTTSASPRTCGAAHAAGTRRKPSTCRRPTRSISSGPRRASRTGPRPWVRRRRRSSRQSSPTGRTRRWATARAWASFDSGRNSASGSSQRAPVRCSAVRAATRASPPS